MRAEDEAAREVGRVVVGRPARQRRDEGRVDRDEVGFLAGLERADDVVEAERPRAVERAEPQPVERPEDGPASTPATVAARSGRRTRRA